MIEYGYVPFPREITKRPWYNDGITLKLYIYLLCSAAFRDIERAGYTIRQGQFVTSVRMLSEECQQSVQQTRTALNHLKATNDITIRTTPSFSIITLNALVDPDYVNKPANTLANTLVNKHINNISKKVKKEKEKINKEEERALSRPSASDGPLSPALDCSDDASAYDSEARTALVEAYGERTVTMYEERFCAWAANKKTAQVPMYATIAKWLAQDFDAKFRNAAAAARKTAASRRENSASSLDTQEIDARILRQYKDCIVEKHQDSP